MNLTAKARMRGPDEVGPSFICCDGMRESTARFAGQIIEVLPNQAYRTRRACDICGTMHEVTAIPMTKRVNRCGTVAAEWIDIDEGSFAEAATSKQEILG